MKRELLDQLTAAPADAAQPSSAPVGEGLVPPAGRGAPSPGGDAAHPPSAPVGADSIRPLDTAPRQRAADSRPYDRDQAPVPGDPGNPSDLASLGHLPFQGRHEREAQSLMHPVGADALGGPPADPAPPSSAPAGANAECGIRNLEFGTNKKSENHSAFLIQNSELENRSAAPNLRAHLSALAAEAAAIPGFDLAAALRDPAFVRLTAPGVGVGVRRAWLALHPELLERRAAAESAAMLARSLQSGAARPREGRGQSGAPLAADYRALPRSEQRRLKQRIADAAARGEKIYP